MATEVKQRNNRVLVLVGALLAAAAFGAVLYLSQHNSSSGSSSNAPQVSAVYSSVDIPKGTKIDASMVTVKQVSADAVPPGTPADTTLVVGKFTAVPVTANTAMLPSLYVADAASATTAALSIQPLDIHQGYVAVALPVKGQGDGMIEDAVEVGNYIRDDDHIDIIIDAGGPNGASVRYSFQDIRVLKAGSYGQAATEKPTVLIVELPRAQAEEITALVLGKGQQSVLKYVLRAKKDYGATSGANYMDIADPNVPVKKDQPVTPDVLNRLFPAR